MVPAAHPRTGQPSEQSDAVLLDDVNTNEVSGAPPSPCVGLKETDPHPAKMSPRTATK